MNINEAQKQLVSVIKESNANEIVRLKNQISKLKEANITFKHKESRRLHNSYKKAFEYRDKQIANLRRQLDEQ